ncbi:hypothetical protein BKN14_03610 [Candidatus Gracilibacteria bacterium HOT-871]|nr:hypothetical protein BKN14_03610 [Candidatus Gracilibacteria bacterium HOT-871]MBB1564746.1 hypothetical protein [Candidatus Gracilibacteria bacterium]RKW23252.1 MAG: hypothetical protein D8B46_03660 [Candidatus Gracilibacteria bacterium]
MKKKILLIITLLFGIIFTNISNAEDSAPTNVTITVGTQVPGVPCTMKKDDKTDGVVYVCSVPKSSKGIVDMLGNIISYATFITGIAGVLFIVINGILYSMGGIDDDLRGKSKERIIRTLTGLIILFSAGYILQLVAPWVYK